MPTRPRRLDPVGCGCTDCLTGYSVPIDRAPLAVFDAYVAGAYSDRQRETVIDASATTEREFDEWIQRAEIIG